MYETKKSYSTAVQPAKYTSASDKTSTSGAVDMGSKFRADQISQLPATPHRCKLDTFLVNQKQYLRFRWFVLKIIDKFSKNKQTVHILAV